MKIEPPPNVMISIIPQYNFFASTLVLGYIYKYNSCISMILIITAMVVDIKTCSKLDLNLYKPVN